MKQRNRSLDIAKGICLICMILVHMFSWWNGAYPKFNQYTGVFFLVFFFFASGLCFKIVPWKKYVVKRFKRLLLPYYIYCAVYAAYLWVIRGQFNGLSLLQRLYVIIVNTIECFPTGMSQVDFFHVDTYGVGPVWFIHCIFIANIFYRIICRWKYRLPVAIIAALLAAISQRFVLLPFNLQDAVIGCMFIAMGDCAKGLYQRTLDFLNNRKYSLHILVFLCIAAVYVLMIEKLDYQWMNLGENTYYMRSILATCLGFCLVIILAHFIERTAILDEILEFYGRNSMFILVMHSVDILMIRNWGMMSWQFVAVTLMAYIFVVYLKNRIFALAKNVWVAATNQVQQ